MNRLLLIAAALLALTSGASAAELPQIPSVLRLPTPPAPSFELPALPPSPQPSLPSPTAAFGDRFGDWRLDLAQEVTAGLRPNQSGWDRMLNDPELLRLGHLRTIDLRGKGVEPVEGDDTKPIDKLKAMFKLNPPCTSDTLKLDEALQRLPPRNSR